MKLILFSFVGALFFFVLWILFIGLGGGGSIVLAVGNSHDSDPESCLGGVSATLTILMNNSQKHIFKVKPSIKRNEHVEKIEKTNFYLSNTKVEVSAWCYSKNDEVLGTLTVQGRTHTSYLLSTRQVVGVYTCNEYSLLQMKKKAALGYFKIIKHTGQNLCIEM